MPQEDELEGLYTPVTEDIDHGGDDSEIDDPDNIEDDPDEIDDEERDDDDPIVDEDEDDGPLPLKAG